MHTATFRIGHSVNDSTASLPWERVRLRVPRENGRLLDRPELSDAARIVERNASLLKEADCDVQGRTFQKLRSQARVEVLAAACEYTKSIGGDVTDSSCERIIVSGHQPSLFHVGVWVKNFAAASIAARVGGVGLNLIVDNDIAANRRVRVPSGTLQRPLMESLAFDVDQHARPWEDVTISDRALFESFGQRAVDSMRRWKIDPVIGSTWPHAVSVANANGASLRDGLTAARRTLELELGVNNLELPISRLCHSDSFLRFVSHILAWLPKFSDIHNAVLEEHRLVNRVRSRTHPVPALIEEAGWFEAPFWVWRDGETRRARLMAKQIDRTIELSDGRSSIGSLPLAPDMDACCAIEAMQALQADGWRIRPRALTNTLFARLFLSDLFVHGIGGAKYDEMTDRIINRFFGLTPPTFQTLSATLHLPIENVPACDAESALDLASQLRDLNFNPQRYITDPSNTEVASLIAEKHGLIEEEQHKQPPKNFESHLANRARYRRLREINRLLAPSVQAHREKLQSSLADTREQLSAKNLLQSREFSFALFPKDLLGEFFASADLITA